jgi:hypothetical protein
MEIKGVKIGDKFMLPGKAMRAAEVVDIYTVTNSAREIVKYLCIAGYNFLGQKMRVEVPFSTVKMNKTN